MVIRFLTRIYFRFFIRLIFLKTQLLYLFHKYWYLFQFPVNLNTTKLSNIKLDDQMNCEPENDDVKFE